MKRYEVQFLKDCRHHSDTDHLAQAKLYARSLAKWNLAAQVYDRTTQKIVFRAQAVTLTPGNEPPPHVHSHEDELFYVLSGESDVYVGEEAFKVKTGECIFLPRFKPHAFVIRSPRLRLLTLFTPAGLEEAFRKVGTPAQYLDLPSEAITYSMVELDGTARRFNEYGARFLTPDEIKEQLPLYPEPLPLNSNDEPTEAPH